MDVMQYLRREIYPIFEDCTIDQRRCYIMTTSKDFNDCPDCEEFYYNDHSEVPKFPYNSSFDEDDDSISLDSEEEPMDNKQLQYSGQQWSSHRMPPPQYKPPKLTLPVRKDHLRAPPTGGPDRTPSPSNVLRGQLDTKLQLPNFRNARASKISPPTVSSTPSPCPSESSESCATPTNELGERGSPAGASISSSTSIPSNKTNSRIHIPKQKVISNSQPAEQNGSHIEAGILLSPQLKRSSRLSLPNKYDFQKNMIVTRSARQGFLQKKVPTVASRIKQFEIGPQHVSQPQTNNKQNYDSLNDDTVTSNIAMNNVIDNKETEKKMTDKASLDQKKTTQENENQRKLSTETVSTIDEPRSEASPTSSMEELSLINQGALPQPAEVIPSPEKRPPRPEAIVQPHKHAQFAFNPHYSIPFGRPPGSTYIQPPTQPIATPGFTTISYNTAKPPYTTLDQQQRIHKPATSVQQSFGPSQQQPHATPQQIYPSPVQQPLGIATANLALAHNAAANGDIVMLRKLILSGEVNILTRDDYGSTLIHTAATYGQLAALQLISKEVQPTSFLLADNNFLTPPLLAIQGGHLECLKFLIEEMSVPLTVPDAGGETLLHHAAFHGQVKCLEYLLHRAKKSSQPFSYVDESGVSPAHFAAQRGHMDCLRLLINWGFDVTAPDRENMKPADWADAMGQHSCTQYLLLFELCLQLSRDITLLLQDRQMLYHENNQLHELLDIRDKEHHTAIAKLHQQHQEDMHKVHEKYAGITVSALLRGNNDSSVSNNSKIPSSHKSSIISNSSKGKNEGKEKKKVKIIPEPLTIQEIPPTDILRRQLSDAEDRLIASREKRKIHPVMATRSFSPLSPLIRRLSSQENSDTENEKSSEKTSSFSFSQLEAMNSYKLDESLIQGVEDVPHSRKSPPQNQTSDHQHTRKSPPQSQTSDHQHTRKSPPQSQTSDIMHHQHTRKSPPQSQTSDIMHHQHTRKSPPQSQTSGDMHHQHTYKSDVQRSPTYDQTNELTHLIHNYQRKSPAPADNSHQPVDTSLQKSPQHRANQLQSTKSPYYPKYGMYPSQSSQLRQPSASSEMIKTSQPMGSFKSHQSKSNSFSVHSGLKMHGSKDNSCISSNREPHPLTLSHSSPQHTRYNKK